MRIAIVNDVRAAAEALRRVVASLPGHSVAWTAADGAEAVEMARRDRPDLILMDLVMPRLDGAQATREIMAHAPCAILVVTATVSGNMPLVYDAMGHGALDAVDTPVLGPTGDVAGAVDLAAKIATVAKIVGQTREGRPAAATQGRGAPPLLVIGASTGGPKAVSDVLLGLPREDGPAVVVVQHVDVAFSSGLASWLGSRTGHPVRVAEDGEPPQAGVVLVAGTNDHLVLTGDRVLAYRAEPRELFYRPSVDVFYESVADHWPKPGTAVLLTGMGRDGARGMARLRASGWHTIAQDEASSVVWSMPKAAIDAGGASETLPLDAIAGAILRRLPR
ncbi:MAG: chemotaxis-specific protein-glutamate methyltransferase CheB [Planctomycetia bacterium]